MINNQYPLQPQPNLAPQMVGQSDYVTAIKIALGVAAALIALLLGALVLLLIGIGVGPIGFVVGLLCATIPVPIYIMLVL
jgi:hypothetical protein